MRNILGITSAVLLIFSLLFMPNFASAQGQAAVNSLQSNGQIMKWIVAGPFPNEKVDQPTPPEDVTRLGFQIDFLTDLGGEKFATFARGQKITYGEEEILARAQQPNKRNIVDIQALYLENQLSVAYAYCEIQSDREQPVHFFLGHDDCAKMWLNDSLIHRVWSPDGMGIISRQFHLTGKLKPGRNRIMLKVENWGYDWGFQLEAFDAEAVKPILQEMADDAALVKFQDCHPQPKGEWDYMIAPGGFPEIVWNNPKTVTAFTGDTPMTVQWFNTALDSVDEPIEPGRYIAYVTAPTRSGIKIRRQVTIFCRDAQWLPWFDVNKVYADYFPNSGFDPAAFEAHKPHTAPFLGQMLHECTAKTEAGAIINSYWQELTADKTLEFFETPDVISNDIQVKLKQKILNISSDDMPKMPLPKITPEAGRILHSGTADAAEVKKEAAEKLRQICQEWYEKSGEPFNILVARHGVIVLHDAFGPCKIDQKFSVASITKAVAGLTFARFVDTGLIDIETPVGQFLPDFPITGEKAMTMRHLFTHTTGLDGHGNWGGIQNAWLDNVIALTLEKLPIGKVHQYNGMGYDLAGKVMEIVGGKSIQRLVQEQLWLPLGITGSSLNDLGYSAMLNAEDIGKMGQLILNQGSYGNQVLFSPETCRRILPTDLRQFYPDVDVEWGIGLAYRRTEKDANSNKSPFLLSKNIVGHGSASQCIFLVDLEHDLVISQARRTGGREYDVYYRKLLAAVEDILK